MYSGTDLITKSELLFAEFHASAQTFCDTEAFIIQFACELEAHSAEARPAGGVDPQAGSQFVNDGTEIPCFEASARGERAVGRKEA